MKFFIDTADVDEVKRAAEFGVLDGVTTNPSLVAKTGRSYIQVIEDICEFCAGPVSAEVIATDYGGMMVEARKWAKVAPQVVVKIPLIGEGLRAVRQCREEGIDTNVTLCFNSVQALLAAKAGASFISPFLGRLDDIGHDSMQSIEEIQVAYANYDFKTEILAASIRTPAHVRQLVQLGVDVITLPLGVLLSLLKHPLTEQGLAKFLEDAKKIPGLE